jgi:hypothetical protein
VEGRARAADKTHIREVGLAGRLPAANRCIVDFFQTAAVWRIRSAIAWVARALQLLLNRLRIVCMLLLGWHGCWAGFAWKEGGFNTLQR